MRHALTLQATPSHRPCCACTRVTHSVVAKNFCWPSFCKKGVNLAFLVQSARPTPPRCRWPRGLCARRGAEITYSHEGHSHLVVGSGRGQSPTSSSQPFSTTYRSAENSLLHGVCTAVSRTHARSSPRTALAHSRGFSHLCQLACAPNRCFSLRMTSTLISLIGLLRRKGWRG